MEKRRRERINKNLQELKLLVLEALNRDVSAAVTLIIDPAIALKPFFFHPVEQAADINLKQYF